MRGMIPVLILMGALPMSAQFFQRLFNPDVNVTLNHPPGLGIQVKRVGFAPVTDSRAEEVVSACIAELSRSDKLEVLDRGNTDRVLAEQRFSNSGLVDSAQAVELGKLLGSPVMLLVKVFTLKTTKTPLFKRSSTEKDDKGQPVVTYIAKTQTELTASIQAVDCATGRIHSVQRVVASPSMENSSTQGTPEFPLESEVREKALAQAATQVMRLLLPWTEERKLIFYDDKDYGMKEAHRLLAARDYAGAEVKSLEALSKARGDAQAKPKYLARTNYNLGMCKFIAGDYAAAEPYLKAALGIEAKNGIFKESLEECERAIHLQKEMARVEGRSALKLVQEPAPSSRPAQAAAAPTAAPPASADKDGNLSVEERLDRLDRLRKKGLLSPEEYAKRRAELLDKL